MKRIYWVSQHKPTPKQIHRLAEVFGDVEIIHDEKPFDDAKDIVKRYKKSKADDIVVVAPLTVLHRLTELGVRPLYAEMAPAGPETADIRANGKYYRFLDFRRIHGVSVDMRPIALPDRKDRKLSVRISEELYRQARRKALKEGQPLSRTIRRFLREWVKS